MNASTYVAVNAALSSTDTSSAPLTGGESIFVGVICLVLVAAIILLSILDSRR